MGVFNIFKKSKKTNYLSEENRAAISFLRTLLNRVETFKNSEVQLHKNNPAELSGAVLEFKQTLEISRRELVKLKIKDANLLSIPEFKFSDSNFNNEIKRLEYSLNDLSTKIELIIKQINDDSMAQFRSNTANQAANEGPK